MFELSQGHIAYFKYKHVVLNNDSCRSKYSLPIKDWLNWIEKICVVHKRYATSIFHIWPRKNNWLSVLVLYAAFNTVSVISRFVLGKLSVLLVHLSWHQLYHGLSWVSYQYYWSIYPDTSQPVSRNADPATLSKKLLPFLNYLVWPGRVSDRRPPTP